ncbi:MAG TPA: carboxypeptidase-like regulatory domain-containing protein [Bryobacteraceae bacterium]|nr:carboxypeptidase-like regulatory domain-containing protein [Bryobacteraceae bacterium]
MKQIIFLLCAFAASALGQTGRITGAVVDDSGTPIQGARVAASLWSSAKPVPFVAGRPPAFMPVPASALTGSKGEFEVSGLHAGKYYVCVEKPEAAILNPCLWADPPASVDVGEGAAVSGISVVAANGVTLNIRVQDAKGLLGANPASDDVRVGTSHRRSPFIPGIVSGRDPAGKVMSVIVPRGQAATVSVSSASFALSDERGAALAGTEISVPAEVVASAGAAPVVTVRVTDVKPRP